MRSRDIPRGASLRPTLMRGGLSRTVLLLVIAAGVVPGVGVFLAAKTSTADSVDQVRRPAGLFYCATPTSGPMSDPSTRRQIRFDAALNAAHGITYIASAAGIQYGTSPTRRSSGNNPFDDGIRDGLRGGSPSSRQDADTASDVTLAFGLGVLPLASMGAQYFRNHDCLETMDMASDWIESFGLTLLLTQATKVATGRERPYTKECGSNPPRDAHCGNEDRHLSFFSGHASLTGAGAGLTCAFSIRRNAWGHSRNARYTPCALGITTALATGVLRITADKHWGTDVLMGFAIGGLVGYFDTWGPLDLLRFKTRDSRGHVSSTGMFLPFAREGQLGAQVLMVF